MAFPAAEIDSWFETLEESFGGKLPVDHALIRTFGGQGWRVRTMGVELVVLADRDFPYSKPQAFLQVYDQSRPIPHVEPIPRLGAIGRLCLTTPIVPHDPLLAVQSALHDARQLLKANENDEEDGDFGRDLGAYWSHYLPQERRNARLAGLSDFREGIGAFFYSSDDTYYCFPSKVELRRWWKHLAGAFIRAPHRFPIIRLRRLPKPDRFPKDIETLLAFLKRYTVDGLMRIGEMLRACPTRLPIVFSGSTGDGRKSEIAVELVLIRDEKGRSLTKARVQAKLPDEDVIRLYDAFPLNTRRLDSALSRLPGNDIATTGRKVVVVGCGALGAGIAVMLAKAGVSRLVLIDPELLGWENIRRHELGGEWVGAAKATALKSRLERSMPDMMEVVAFTDTFQTTLGKVPGLLNDVDLVISATGDWGCDVAVEDATRAVRPAVPTIYTWTEAFALAAHAVLLSGSARRFTEGFDATGSFSGKASNASRKVPPECGNATSPFGAVEISQSQALAARLALELISGRHDGADVWRTWTAEASTLEDANGRWTEYWLESRGQPPALGGVSEGSWTF
jgi:molybdopterin/thiamine biosynthesis adenylyltransferase